MEKKLVGETPPVLVPVHNLGAGGNTPAYWLPPPRGLGWKHAMFNAFFLGNGRHVSSLGDLAAWVDSGGFLFLEAPQRRLAGLHGSPPPRTGRGPGSWSEDLVEEVLRRQESFGASVAFTLDYPLPPRAQREPGCCPGAEEESLVLTARAAGLAYQLRSKRSMRLLVVLQYNSGPALRRLLERLSRELRAAAGLRLDEVDGFAVGGLVPVSSRLSLLVERIQVARRLLGWEPWLHVLGVASPRNIGLLYAAGADSADSKTYIIAAAKRLYYLPPGVEGPARIEVKKNPGFNPSKACGCPACSQYQSLGEMRANTRALAIHNLYVSLAAARAAREACVEGRLVESLAVLAGRDVRIAKGVRALREPRGPGRC